MSLRSIADSSIRHPQLVRGVLEPLVQGRSPLLISGLANRGNLRQLNLIALRRKGDANIPFACDLDNFATHYDAPSTRQFTVGKYCNFEHILHFTNTNTTASPSSVSKVFFYSLWSMEST